VCVLGYRGFDSIPRLCQEIMTQPRVVATRADGLFRADSTMIFSLIAGVVHGAQ